MTPNTVKNGNLQNPEIVFEPLRRDVKLFQDESSGSATWMLFDPVADKYFRLGKKEHSILSLFSDAMTEKDLLEKVKKIDESITPAEIRNVFSFLQTNKLLQAMPELTESHLKRLKEMKRKHRLSVILQSYLFFKIPLLRPDKFLTDTLELAKTIFNKWLLLIISITSFCGYALLVMRWQKFESTIVESLTYAGMLKYGMAIVLMKAIHELAHAYTAKSAGVRVRSFGIGFIVFFPRFFTDITDSWRIKDKNKKLLVDAAGILSELLIGGVAVIFWTYSNPGALQTVSYYIFAVSIINTVLVNGNPFIRYDGYYILMDLVNIDNLQMKSRMLIRKFFRESFFGIKMEIPFHFSGWRKGLIIAFGISSFIYRIFLYTGIILIIYYKFTKIVGIILVVLEIYFLLVKPLHQEVLFILKSLDKAQRKKVLAASSGIFAFLFIFFVPLPWTVSLPCIVGSAQDNIIYVQTPGFLTGNVPLESRSVNKGESLFALENPFLVQDANALDKSLKIRKTELDQIGSFQTSKLHESPQSKIQQIEYIRNNIKENNRKIQQLTIKSPIEGTFALFDRKLKVGKWLEYGEALGEVFSEKTPLVYAYAEEKNAASFSPGDKVRFYMNDGIRKYTGKIIRINPVPTREWRSSPLLETAGGPLPILKKEAPDKYIMKKYYYQIVIKPDNVDGSLGFSRTGVVQTRDYSSIGVNFIRTAISALQKELAL